MESVKIDMYVSVSNGIVNEDNKTMQKSSYDGDTVIGVKWPLLPLKISLALIGLVCNAFIFIGLTECKKRMRTLDVLLLNLAIWDTVFLSSRICQQIMQALITNCKHSSACRRMYFTHHIFNYIARACFITSMMATLSVAIERYLYSFMPIKINSSKNKRRTKFIVCAVFSLSFIVSLPETVTVFCAYHVYVEDTLNGTVWLLCRGKQFKYVVKSGVLLRLTVKILAWISLLVLDSVLVYRLMNGARRARRMYVEDRGQLYHPRSYNERSLTVAVMTLVLMSLVAYPVTGLVWVLTYESVGWNGLLDPRMIPGVQEVGKVAQLIYASSNLFFLLLFGKRFKRNLGDRINLCIVCCLRRKFQR